MSKSKHSRRAFLKAIGMGPALLPALSTDDAFGGCLANPPRRAVFVVWTNGYQEWVSGSGSTFTFPDYMKALEPHKADMIAFKGVKYQNLRDTPNPQKADAGGHGASPAILTGRKYKDFRPFVEVGGGPSADQFIAAKLAASGVKTPRGALTLGVLRERYICTWRDAGQPAQPERDPYKAFADLFAGGSGQAADPLLEKNRAMGKSIVDLVLRDLNGFRARVGKENQIRIDAHLASLRELENNMAGVVPANGCMPPVQGATKIDPNDTRNFPATTKMHMDLVAAAFAADACRTAVIQLGGEGDNVVVPSWLGFNPTGKSGGLGDDNSHHSIAHRGGDPKRKVDAWFCEMFAYLIAKLKAEKEGTSHVLDNSVVVIANHMATGGGHQTENVPWLLAGKCGGYFKVGQSLSGNVSHTAVLKEIIKAMRVDPAGFFEPEYDLDMPALRA